MPTMPDFRLENHFSKWEFKARYHMTASDAEAMSMRDLLAMATPAEREAFEGMWLGYTETFGAPDLASAPPFFTPRLDAVRCALRYVASVMIVLCSALSVARPTMIRAKSPLSLQRFQRL